eukprot:1175712-Prorocentrum_minimum.AAC.4
MGGYRWHMLVSSPTDSVRRVGSFRQLEKLEKEIMVLKSVRARLQSVRQLSGQKKRVYDDYGDYEYEDYDEDDHHGHRSAPIRILSVTRTATLRRIRCRPPLALFRSGTFYLYLKSLKGSCSCMPFLRRKLESGGVASLLPAL